MKHLLLFTALITNIISYNQSQIGLDIDGEAFGDGSGYSVSMPDAYTVAIGAPFNKDSGYDAGHVRIYVWNGISWTQKGNDIDGEASGDYSGISVSMPDSNSVAIGAHINNIVTGHVRIYKWNGTSWIQKGSDIDGEATYDNSGISISMPDTNTIAIGAPGNNNGTGHVRVYMWDGIAWTQKGIDIDGEASGDGSGGSVCMPDAYTVAIGAPNNSGNAYYAGHVRIYAWNGIVWAQKGNDIDGDTLQALLGESVSMPDANTVAIGSSSLGNSKGYVRIYKWNGNTWTQKGSDIDGEASGDYSGTSVSMPDSNIVAIGAKYNDGNGTDAGHVRIYKWNGIAWTQIGIDIDGEAYNDRSGCSVSMPDANTVAIGAAQNLGYATGLNDPTGQVRVYSLIGSSASIENNQSNNLNLSIYPNPSSGVFEINHTSNGSVQLEILDIYGKLIYKSELTEKSNNINLSNQVAGIYFIHLIFDNKIHETRKISIN